MEIEQAKINIGIIGHVDHGKTSLVKAMTGEWISRHSEEIKRGITIRLGYADAKIYFCEKCKKYCLEKTCKCGHKAKFIEKISFVDCPGHENLMAVMISGASLMDAAILVIAANEKCPQPQTQEHLNALDITQIKNVIIVQNKVDLVTKEQALANQQEIKNFVKGTVAENAPIIPVSANYGVNIPYIIEFIADKIKIPERDVVKPFALYIARSFDINRPGTEIKELKGGVVGGSVIRGELKVGDLIEIRPGIEREGDYKPVQTEVTSLSIEEGLLKKVVPGGLVAIGTKLDPAMTKNDKMVGNVVGKPGTLPKPIKNITFNLHKFSRMVTNEVLELNLNDLVIINAGTAMSPGTVIKKQNGLFTIQLKRPMCIEKSEKIGISKRSGSRWVLIGYGETL